MTPFGPEIISLVLPTADVDIVDTWHSMGMRGTDSQDVGASGVFVPASRTFGLAPEYVPTAPFDGPLYRLPALVATCTIVAPVALAIARGASDELRRVVTTKVPIGSMKTARDRAAVQAAVATAEGMLRSGRLFFYDTLSTARTRALAGGPFSLEQKADQKLASAWAIRSAAPATGLMHEMGGTSGIYTRSRLERHFRDAQTVRHHGCPEAALRRSGTCTSASTRSSRSSCSDPMPHQRDHGIGSADGADHITGPHASSVGKRLGRAACRCRA
jgi:alkylation response protein AidB-like acyl-CoA dehydrogenase